MKKTEAILIASMFCLDAFVADRIFKYLVMGDRLQIQTLWPGVLSIVKHQNFGLMGNLPVPLFASVAISLVALVVLVYAVIQSAKRERMLECLALGLLLGGALGNLFDRIVFGYVFDWLMWFNLSIINLADVCIAIGIGAYLLAQYLETRKSKN